MSDILDTGIKICRNVGSYVIGSGSFRELGSLIGKKKTGSQDWVVYFVDHYFRDSVYIDHIREVDPGAAIFFIDSTDEPTTDMVNSCTDTVHQSHSNKPCAIVGIGGGTTMDIAKAVSNLLTNGGAAEDYQGWDLVKVPGIFKIGIPTISGTGAEATRTCVMTNKISGLKLGMNSDYTVFDQLVLDPELSATTPRDQYFYTGMDAYIHCIESLAGSYRNSIGAAYCEETIRLCRSVFSSEDMKSPDNRSDLMVASYLGGCAIATSYVGIVHPFSAGLSVVFGLHHCVANCIALNALEEFYPESYKEFNEFMDKQGIRIPGEICRDANDETYDRLYNATVIHEKPLTNALGEDFRRVLTPEKVRDIFSRM
jgi:3-deoxy-alpha-D-manno-octulosonate 8-oxidase